jgi:hypothetical protein
VIQNRLFANMVALQELPDPFIIMKNGLAGTAGE